MAAKTRNVVQGGCCGGEKDVKGGSCCGGSDGTTVLQADDLRAAVRARYAGIAVGKANSCCGGSSPEAFDEASVVLGYSEEDVASVPEGANMGLGCGNPQAIAALKPGETVLDLGSGGGFDCFLASKAVGESGRVIGVDMTPEMVQKARANAVKIQAENVEFRLGEIEHLPVADDSVDVILSNCVINLSPDKPQVYREAFRVLKSGGRLAISDVVALRPLPEPVLQDVKAYTGCLAGASLVADVEQMLIDAGFVDVRVVPKSGSREVIDSWVPGADLGHYVASATVEAVKAR